MSTDAPRFKRFIKTVNITSGGSGYFGNPSEYILIPAPNTTDVNDTSLQATATVTFLSGAVSAVTITEPGDGYASTVTPVLQGSPSAISNISTVDPNRDAGTYTSIPADSSDYNGTNAVVTFTVDGTGAVTAQSVAYGTGQNYREGEKITINPISFGGQADHDPVVFQVTHIGGGSGATFSTEVDYIAKASDFYVDNKSWAVEHQIPEWIAEDNPLFTKFFEYYYDFLDRNTSTGIGPSNILDTFLDRYNVDFKDSDEVTTTNFLETFLTDYGKDFPQTATINNELLVKNLQEFYTTKGSFRAIELLFRMLYNEKATVKSTSEFVLRASDGVWNEEYVVRVVDNNALFERFNITAYNPESLQGQQVDVHYKTSSGSVTSNTIVQTSVDRVKTIAYTSPQIYELTLNLKRNTTIEGPGSSDTYTAVIGGKFGNVSDVGAADGSRTAGTYTIGTSDYTTDSVAGTGATFSIVVDGSGAATVTVTAVGTNYAPGETITVADSKLGSGGGAALTFKVGTITEGYIRSITIDTGGLGYVANPPLTIREDATDTITTKAVASTRITSGAVTSVVIDTAGLGYNKVPTVTSNNFPIFSFVSLRDEDPTLLASRKATILRVLTGASVKANSHATDGGFKTGQVYQIDEAAAAFAGYAIDYFAEDYTLTGISNKGFLRIKAVDANKNPKSFDVISVGSGYTAEQFDINITSPNGETSTLTCTTGHSTTYPGVHETSTGFLSDVNRIQDNNRYQSYAYDIETSRSKTDWGDFVKRAAHPAGMKMGSALLIEQEVDFATAFSVTTDVTLFTVIPDIEEVLVQDAVALDIEIVLTVEAFSVSDAAPTFEVTTTASDGVIASDDGALYAMDYFLEDYAQDDMPVLDFEKFLTEYSTGEYALDYFLHDGGRYTLLIDDDALEDNAGEVFAVDDAISSFDVTYVLADSAEMSESIITSLVYFRTGTDSVDMGDALDSLDIGVGASDQPVTDDAINLLDIETVLGDDAEAADVITSFDITVVYTDSSDVQDAPSLEMGVTPVDTNDVQDVAVLAVEFPAADGAETADTLSIEPQLVGTDTANTQDAVNNFDVTTVAEDGPQTAELVVREVGINSTDSADIADAGSASSQSYAAGDYFLEDYVADTVVNF